MKIPSNRLNLDQLKTQAKELVRAARTLDTPTLDRVKPYFDAPQSISLVQSQLVIARENGFDSWASLKRHCETTPQPEPKSRTQRFFDAIEGGNAELASEMLAETPDLAARWQRTEWGWTSPLHVAARLGHLAICQLLIDAGAVIYATNQGDYPPVFDAIHQKHHEVASLLLDASAKSDNGQPPTYGCGIDIVLAGRLGMLDRVRMHVEKDPLGVYRRGCIGESVLHWPAHNGHVAVLEFLLDSGAILEADEIGLYGGKPLHWASEHAPDCVRLLLSRGANPNALNTIEGEFEGFTPLHMMARQREQCIECAQMLLNAGADLKLRDARGRLPIDVARELDRDRVVAFLEKLSV